MIYEECFRYIPKPHIDGHILFYSGAYFSGQIEHPGRHFFRNNNDDPVFVAINTDGVFVIDMDDTVSIILPT